jgi:tetratricopeptide (TPR) repeat protein
MLATSAHADELAKPSDAIALEHLTTGNLYYRRLHDFEKAIEEYKAGALREDAPVFSYNLAQCYRMLGRYKDAIWHYERFLDRGKPRGEVEVFVRKLIAEMKGELEKTAMKQPVIEPAPHSASSSPDHSVPLPVGVAPIVVARRPQWYEDTFGWGMAGTGMVTVGASGLMFLSASRLTDQANAEPNQQAQRELRDKADTRQLLGTVIGVGGAALIVTGVVKLAINGGDQPHGLGLRVGRGGVMVFGRF